MTVWPPWPSWPLPCHHHPRRPIRWRCPGAWLTTAELARLLGVARGTIGSWDSGHIPRPGFELERRKEGSPNRGGAVWWRVVAEAERKEGPKPARQ